MKRHNPDRVPAPASSYSQAVETAPGARWLHVSGQVPVDAQGHCPGAFPDQCEQAWRNLVAVLEAAGMDVERLVKVNVYLTREEDLAAFREIRDRFLGATRPASTIVFVKGLCDPDWRIEIEATAANEGGATR